MSIYSDNCKEVMVEKQEFLEELDAELGNELDKNKAKELNDKVLFTKMVDEGVNAEDSPKDPSKKDPLQLGNPHKKKKLENTKPLSTPKRTKSAVVEDDCEVETPEGWKRIVVQRQGGLSAGKCDVYYFSPLGKKLRSRNEIISHCEQNNIPLDIGKFVFKRVGPAGINNKKVRQTKSLSGTPKLPKIKLTSPSNSADTSKRKSKVKTTKTKAQFFKISSDGLTKVKLKSSSSLWVPPKSPFNLIQESLFQDPWKLLIGTIFINRTTGDDNLGSQLLWEFFKCWPTPQKALKADWTEIANKLKSLPNNEKRAKMIIKFSDEFVNKKWTYPKELHGIGKYGNDSYRIFCINEWRKVKPTDFLLTFYVDWLWDNHTVLGLK